MNFLSPLLSNGVIFDDDIISEKTRTGSSIINSKDKSKPIRKFAEFFMDIALQSFELQKYKYSVQAMASIVAARKTLNIEPAWNPRLNITINASKSDEYKSFNYNDVKDCYTTLFNKYERHFSKYQKTKEVITKPKEKPVVAAPVAEKPKTRNRILSGTRIGELTRNKQLNKNASQPLFDKFMTRKASYVAYIKGSKINTKKNLKQIKEVKNIKNTSIISRMHSVSTIGAIKNKRTSVENLTTLNRVKTPKNMIIGNVSTKAIGGRKVTSESTQRGQSSNYRKLRVHRIGDRKRSHVIPEHKFKTKKADVSRNRSISVNSKIKSKQVYSKPLIEKVDKLTKFDTLPDNDSQVLALISSNETKKQNKICRNLSPMRDQNLEQSLQNCNFTMTDENETSSQVYSRRQRRVK